MNLNIYSYSYIMTKSIIKKTTSDAIKKTLKVVFSEEIAKTKKFFFNRECRKKYLSGLNDIIDNNRINRYQIMIDLKNDE